MRTILWVVLGMEMAALLYFFALDLRRYYASPYELRQSNSKLQKLINKNYQDIAALRVFDQAILVAVTAGLLVYLEQSLAGLLYALGGITALYIVSKLTILSNIAAHLFELHYEFVCKLAARLRFILKYIVPLPLGEHKLQSREEFIDTVKTLPSTVLVPLERQRIELLFTASEKTVKDIMTPKRRITMVEPSSTLGPIVLSDLQKSGHGYFPVATKKGEPEGILNLSDLSDIQQAKQRSTVREVMSQQIAWVEEATSLYELAEAFLNEKQYLLLVRNSDTNFSGVVTIADLMKHLAGVVKE
ncbi:MAG: CBS domain-containing protein [Candidatus Saccharimonadales bacterium]